MKRNIPILNYNDVWQLLCQNNSNGVIVDGGSSEVMLRIEACMARLKVMGDDNARILWVRAIRNERKSEWLRVGIFRNKYALYMVLGEGRFKRAILIDAGSDDCSNKVNLTKPLLALENHIEALVDWICDNPTEYNTYVRQYLPYSLRSGNISRKVLASIDPSWGIAEDAEVKLQKILKIKATTPREYEKKTLRNYISVWSSAYRIFVEKNAELHEDDRYKQELLEECRTMDDLALFRTHNSKGREIDGLDLDSEADYEHWYEENSSFHCFDVVYARIHLGFVGEGEWRNQHAPFHLAMWFGVSGYWDDVMAIAIGLYERGIHLRYNEIDDIIELLRGEDMIGFRPWPDHYMNRDGVKVQAFLPKARDVGRETYWRIIKATAWEEIPFVSPVETSK